MPGPAPGPPVRREAHRAPRPPRCRKRRLGANGGRSQPAGNGPACPARASAVATSRSTSSPSLRASPREASARSRRSRASAASARSRSSSHLRSARRSTPSELRARSKASRTEARSMPSWFMAFTRWSCASSSAPYERLPGFPPSTRTMPRSPEAGFWPHDRWIARRPMPSSAMTSDICQPSPSMRPPPHLPPKPFTR